MKVGDCIWFLQWSLPLLRLRWQGYRKVRGQVCKRIDRRVRELGLEDVFKYQSFLQDKEEEWDILDSMCRVTISRFYRDRGVFQFLERVVLVKLSEAVLARGDRELRCWSIGCASGEEPYTLAILWDRGVVGRQFPQLSIRILATDADRNMVARAEEGCYSAGSLRELPKEWKDRAFNRRGGNYCVTSSERERVAFLVQDIRRDAPESRFDLILLRNVAFTYFDQPLQRDILLRVKERLLPGGALVVGKHESLPVSSGFTAWPGGPGIYQKPSV